MQNTPMTSLTFRHFIVRNLLLFVFLSGISSCKKDGGEGKLSSVEIAGTAYHTVVIGNQVWIDVNYSGPGGVPYNGGAAKPEYGKYYSYAEVKGFILPAGWRIPSMEDYIRLGASQGIVFTNYLAVKQPASKKLSSATNWLHIPGNNQSGFNAHPAGYIFGNTAPIDGDIS